MTGRVAVTPEELDRLDALEREATAPPWRIPEPNGYGAVVADAPSGHDDEENVAAYGGHLVCESVKAGNAAFIAAARQAVPDLIAALRAAWAERDAARRPVEAHP